MRQSIKPAGAIFVRDILLYLKCFECASRYQSFTQAAEELCITQSAVSQQMRTFSSHLGITLFRRENNRLQLTFVRREDGICLQQGSYRGSNPAVFRTTMRSNIVNRPQKFLQLLERVDWRPVLDGPHNGGIGLTPKLPHYLTYQLRFMLTKRELRDSEAHCKRCSSVKSDEYRHHVS